MSPRSLFDRVWDDHVVDVADDGTTLLYVDLHLMDEVTPPQAFDGLRQAGRAVRRPELTLATEDHNVPTTGIGLPIEDPASAAQVFAQRANCAEFGVPLHSLGSPSQGIVHVIGPELGLSLPGMTIVCGDSHTSTHGAFGAFAFGIGTSEVEHVLATQTITQRRPRTMAVQVDGSLGRGTSAKDLALAVMAELGTGGAGGHVIEYRGPAVRALSMEARMTLCNMSIEAGARAGMIAPDETTFEYVRGRPHAPRGERWEQALAHWRTLRTDDGYAFDRTVRIDAADVTPFVTWGTNPSQVAALSGHVPAPEELAGGRREAAERSLAYMGLRPGTPMREIDIDVVFLGSCTNGRLEDLRAAADVLRGRRVRPRVRMLVVPGSSRVRAEAEAEGLDEVFRRAGAQWRGAGCSMCLGMNPDQLGPGERAVSTSNRNFEGRQGQGGRTHLASPSVAAASAVAGRLASPGELAPV
ncbi:3-isopropylmalate dehydratase large subunit [Pseudonocardia acaciae]|uniref:3-isopropylmalate dehydratase large subunit n=1 Tax=Pseudonocardia acaciae TaxID=551276 RepID=UPI00048ACE6A|nr:3-isopropylmalate dehydratase large subunit [Pseudonocardia acaciae]